MISFDRTSANLSAVWNEINSIKSDTSSMWDFLSTITGVDIDSSILSSISDIKLSMSSLSSEITSLTNNTSYFNNELYSLKTDSSSMASNTSSLNSDVASLYSICSSLSNSISTITGGGGGGLPYYLALSDAVNSSLNFVYNMTGGFDESLFPTYDNFSFCGNISSLGNFSVPTTCLNFSLGNIDLISSLTIDSSSGNSITRTVSLSANSCFDNSFRSIDHLYLTVNSIMTGDNFIYGRYHSYDLNYLSRCTIQYVSGLNLNAFSLEGVSIYRNTVLNFNVRNLYNCYIENYIGDIKAFNINRDSSIRNYTNLINITGNLMEAVIISNQNVSSNVRMDKIKAETFNYNLWRGMYSSSIAYNPFIEAGCASYNTFSVIERDWSLKLLECSYNSFSNASGLDSSRTICKVDLDIRNFGGNSFSSIESLLIHGDFINGNNYYYNIKWLSFEPKSSLQLRKIHGGGGNPPVFSNCSFVDLHNAGNSESIFILEPSSYFFNVGTMRFNRNMSYSLYYTSIPNIQPTNVYTLDFYNADDYISASSFILPSVFSGYDEGNVWISGKPLTEYSYTLSTATS